MQVFSFVVRIKKQVTPAATDYRGWVEYVQSGEKTYFLGLDQLLPIIAKHVTSPPEEGETGKVSDTTANMGDETGSPGKKKM